LKRWPSDPSPKRVHDLRTDTRRLEAIAAAFMLEKRPEMHRS
jgi:hypothetical protein